MVNKIKITESQVKRLIKEDFISWDSPENIGYLLDILEPNLEKNVILNQFIDAVFKQMDDVYDEVGELPYVDFTDFDTHKDNQGFMFMIMTFKGVLQDYKLIPEDMSGEKEHELILKLFNEYFQKKYREKFKHSIDY